MADHKFGEMDISAQESTFNGFVTLMTRAVVVITLVLILMAILGA